jgi:hypothetical protein
MPWLTDCFGSCVDLLSDDENCGGCGDGCWDVCYDGNCGGFDCGDLGLHQCGGGCVDTDSSPLHCGDCGEACAADQFCIGGNCEDYSPAGICDACPCDTCSSEGDLCCAFPGSTDVLVCVGGEADGCP